MFHSLTLKPDFTSPKQNYVSPGSKNKPDALFGFCHPAHIPFVANQKKSILYQALPEKSEMDTVAALLHASHLQSQEL